MNINISNQQLRSITEKVWSLETELTHIVGVPVSLSMNINPVPVEEEDNRKKMIEKVKEAINIIFNIPFDRLASASRKVEIVFARHAFCYLVMLNLPKKISYAKVGDMIGGRDHSTVKNSETVAKELIETDEDFRNKIMQSQRLLEEVMK